MTLGQLIFVANENLYDIDLYDDYDGRLACCYVGDDTFSLTEEGQKEFKDALALEVKWIKAQRRAIIKIPYCEDSEMERLADLVHRFVMATAGYCDCSKYDIWFKIDE